MTAATAAGGSRRDRPRAVVGNRRRPTQPQGRGFVVSEGTHHATGENSYRTIVDGIDVVIEHDPPTRQARLSFTKDGPCAGDHRTRMGRSTSCCDSSGPSASTTPRSGSATDSLPRITSRSSTPTHGGNARPTGCQGRLHHPAFQRRWPELHHHRRRDNIDDPSKVLKFALVQHHRRFAVGNLTAIVGQSVTDPTVSVAQWQDGARVITMQAHRSHAARGGRANRAPELEGIGAQKKLDATGGYPSLPPLRSHRRRSPRACSAMDGRGRSRCRHATPPTPRTGTCGGSGNPAIQPNRRRTGSACPRARRRSRPSSNTVRTYVPCKVPLSMIGAQLHVSPKRSAIHGCPADTDRPPPSPTTSPRLCSPNPCRSRPRNRRQRWRNSCFSWPTLL